MTWPGNDKRRRAFDTGRTALLELPGQGCPRRRRSGCRYQRTDRETLYGRGDGSQEPIRHVSGVLPALAVVERLYELPGKALAGCGDRRFTGGDRIGAEEREVVKDELHLARSDVIRQKLWEHRDRKSVAIRALQVRVLVDGDRSGQPAEYESVLG